MASDKSVVPKEDGPAQEPDREPAPNDSVGRGADRAAVRARETGSPNSSLATNLMIADIALRGGARLLRRLIRARLLKAKYPPDKARGIIANQGVGRALLGTAAARVATRSVPGALFVGGGLLVKAIYDRRKGEAEKAKGEEPVAKDK